MKQPPYRPPPAVFGPVWTALYTTMGYTAYRAWTIGTSSINPNIVSLAKHGATLYTIQLGLNLAYMPLFFGLKRPVEATVDILALTGTVGYLAYVWGQVDEVSAWLLAPYLGWLGFASYLTASLPPHCSLVGAKFLKCLQIGAGYLNQWNFKDKESTVPPSAKVTDTKYVNEADSLTK
ncbi:MAG: hypothetical protein M1814_006581 [Vezdaea aestivalis]|nr:MAG: hypothetical protein M1814_006581 [Vezdaea aestivalis]